jgi:hypothetical protein
MVRSTTVCSTVDAWSGGVNEWLALLIGGLVATLEADRLLGENAALRARIRDLEDGTTCPIENKDYLTSTREKAIAAALRLRSWADNIETYGADITHWGALWSVKAEIRRIAQVCDELGAGFYFADYIGKPVCDPPKLPERTDPKDTWVDLIRCERYCPCRHEWQPLFDSSRGQLGDLSGHRRCVKCRCSQVTTTVRSQ